MKRIGMLFFLSGSLLFLSSFPGGIFLSQSATLEKSADKADIIKNINDAKPDSAPNYKYPEFYRGMYLTVSSANNLKQLKILIEKAKSSNINTLVMDVQLAKNVKCMVPEANVRYCKENGLHPVARIVVFPDGLRNYPVPEKYLEEKLSIAEDACKNGFKEIQFDYIRFHDSGSTARLSYSQRYKFI